MALHKISSPVNANETIIQREDKIFQPTSFNHFNSLNSSIYEIRLHSSAIEVIRAQVRMYTKKNLIPETISGIIVNALDSISSDIHDGCINIVDNTNDIYQSIFTLLNREIPEHMHYLFLAYSPTEHRITALRLWLRDSIDKLDKSLRIAQAHLIDKAEQNIKTIIPSYCYGQNGQPTSLGYILMSYVFMLGRDRSRLEELRKRVNKSPAGAYLGVGTSIEINRRALARSLGFEGVVYNAMDALNDHDFVIEFVSFASICTTHINKIAQEIYDWQHPAYNFITFPSSLLANDFILNQPRYPIILEKIKSQSSHLCGNLNTLLMLNKGTKAGDSSDYREIVKPVIESYDSLMSCIQDISSLVTSFIVNRKRTKEDAQQAYGFAPDIIGWLIKNTNLNYNQAVSVSKNIINYAISNGRKLSLLEITELQTIEPQISDGIYSVLISSRAVISRRSLGGSNPVQVRKSIKIARKEFLKFFINDSSNED